MLHPSIILLIIACICGALERVCARKRKKRHTASFRIFVSIVSMHDPTPALHELFKMANAPCHVRVAIVRRAAVIPYVGKPKHQVTSLSLAASDFTLRAARDQIGEMYNGEPFVLHLHESCMLVKGWDSILCKYVSPGCAMSAYMRASFPLSMNGYIEEKQLLCPRVPVDSVYANAACVCMRAYVSWGGKQSNQSTSLTKLLMQRDVRMQVLHVPLIRECRVERQHAMKKKNDDSVYLSVGFAKNASDGELISKYGSVASANSALEYVRNKSTSVS